MGSTHDLIPHTLSDSCDLKKRIGLNKEITLCNDKEANGNKGSVHVHSSVWHHDVLEADNQ